MKRRLAAALILVCGGAFATQPPPDGKTGRAGAEDLVKEAVFEGFERAVGDSGGEIVELAGGPYHLKSGKILGAIDDVIIDPLIEAATTPGDKFEKFEAWLKAASLGGIKVIWPAYGLTVDAGKLVIGGGVYTTEQMIEAAKAQQIEAIIFGRGFGGVLGSFGNPIAQQDFFTIPKLFGRITPQNFGEKIGSYAELRAVWFGDYKNCLVKELLFNEQEVQAALEAGFPRLEEYWKLKRAELVVDKFTRELVTEILTAKKKAQDEAAALAEAERNKPRDDGGNDDEDGMDVEIEDGAGFGDDGDDGFADDDTTGGFTEEELDDAFDPDANARRGGRAVGQGIGGAGGRVGGDLASPALPLTGTVFDLVEAKPDNAYAPWSVSIGRVSQQAFGYAASYEWSAPPQQVGANGFNMNLKVECRADNGQRIYTGIGAVGGFRYEPEAKIECGAETGQSFSKSLTSLVKPPAQANPGTEIELRVGAFWGLGVTYKYRAR